MQLLPRPLATLNLALRTQIINQFGSNVALYLKLLSQIVPSELP